MSRFFLVLILTAICYSNATFAACVDTVRSESDSREKEYEKRLLSLEPSYKGNTEMKNAYSLYAVKAKKEWFFIIMDSADIYSFIVPKKKKREVEQLNEFQNAAINEVLVSELYKKKTRRKEVGDINLYCYYKLKKKGRKVVKNFGHLNSNDEKTSKFLKIIGAPFKPITSIFQSKEKRQKMKEKKLQQKQKQLQKKIEKALPKIAKG